MGKHGAMVAVWMMAMLASPSYASAAGSGDLEGFTDNFFKKEMAKLAIPGASIAIVQDSKVILLKGYGVSDVQSRRPVDAASTQFRIASVTKTFTALAALQLVQAGRLTLDGDINTHLSKFKVGGGAWGPVTLRQLLTHTAGFDERYIGYRTKLGRPFPEPGDYLAARMPPRTQQPGVVASYSNHGYALAGYLVARASGQSYSAYLNNRVFTPLGMTHTQVLIPPASGGPDLATEYFATGKVQPLEFSNGYPAGAIATTAGDVAKFMIALLRADRGDSVTVISSQVAHAMMTRQFTNLAGTPGYSFGLSENVIAGTRVWMKGGAAPKHSAVLLLIPERNTGVFIALNRQEPTLWDDFIPQFIRRFAPSPSVATEKAPAAIDLARYAGSYLWTRRADASIEKVLNIAAQISVRAEGDGLRTHSPAGIVPDQDWRPIGENRFCATDGSCIAFRMNDQGTPKYLLMDIEGEHTAFERIDILQRTEVQLAILGAIFAVLLTFPLLRFVAFLVWRKRDARPILRAGYFPSVAAFAILVVSLAVGATANALVYGPGPALYALSAAVLIFIMATAGGIWFLLRNWRVEKTIALRMYLVLVSLAALGLCAFFFDYNMIGLHY